jgi:hypothetical protein
MSSVKRIQFTAEISAPASVVWRHVTSLESYKIWTSAFAEGSHFKGVLSFSGRRSPMVVG